MPDDLQLDIQATAEDVAADAALLQGVEAEKASLDADDPRTVELAKQAVDLANGLATKTVVEHALVIEARSSRDNRDTQEFELED